MNDILGRPVAGDIQRSSFEEGPQYSVEEFIERLDAVLNLPGVESVRWTQYTPYFNDGDACVFSVYGFQVRLADTPKDAGDYEDGYLEARSSELTEGIVKHYGKYNRETRESHITTEDFPGGARPDVAEALGNIEESATHRVCLEAFGDHAEVTATREGFSVEYYEHE